jgi:hypothetical protein
MTSSDDNESLDGDPTVDNQDEEEENEDEENEDKENEGEENEDEENEQDEENEEDNASDDQENSDSSSEEDSSSDDDDDDDESKEDGKVAAATTEDGHQLSAYELQRLERIRRNKEYLASLGLEKNKPRPQKTQPARKKRDNVKPARRSSLGRSTKANPISYSENPTPRWQKSTPGDADGSATQAVASVAPAIAMPTKKLPRMDRFIYDEFKRIGAEVKQSLKTAKRNMREADIAYRYAKKKAERYERKQKRENEYKRLVQDIERERNVLGCTAKEMLQHVDSRMYEIESALRMFDHRFHQHANLTKWAEQQAENSRKMEIIDAMDRFPKALKVRMVVRECK